MVFPNNITGTFNHDILLQTGTITVYKEGVLFLTFTESDILISGSTFTIDVTNMFPDLGSYYLNISQGLFTDLSGNEFIGINDIITWAWTIGIADYKQVDYNNTDYNT